MSDAIRILSVEDDDFIKMFLRDIFWLHGSRYGLQFKIVDNVEAAEKILQNPAERPKLILLDVGLPIRQGGELDREAGFKFLEKVKGNPETKNIKVVVYSSHGDKELADRAMKCGATSFS